jgi:hypothetical protein
MTEQSQPTSQEIDELVERIRELEYTLTVAKKCLLEWDRVNKAMLYPHQHRTGSQTKEALKEINEVI